MLGALDESVGDERLRQTPQVGRGEIPDDEPWRHDDADPGIRAEPLEGAPETGRVKGEEMGEPESAERGGLDGQRGPARDDVLDAELADDEPYRRGVGVQPFDRVHVYRERGAAGGGDPDERGEIQVAQQPRLAAARRPVARL